VLGRTGDYHCLLCLFEVVIAIVCCAL
jgi:hypothetical protein